MIINNNINTVTCSPVVNNINKAVSQARARLRPPGLVVLEVGGLRAAMDRAFPALDLHWLPTQDGEDVE